MCQGDGPMPAQRFKCCAGIGSITLRWPGHGVYMYTQLVGLSCSVAALKP